MENKKQIIKLPEIVAYVSADLVIAFENILAVQKSFTVDGQLDIYLQGSIHKITVDPGEASVFMLKYQEYLAFMETAQLMELGVER